MSSSITEAILPQSVKNRIKNYEVWEFSQQMLQPFINPPEGLDINELACAFDYDCKKHPDETVFVTTNPELAEYANQFFGEDSIERID